MRKILRERSRNLNREVWESPSVYGGEDVKVAIVNIKVIWFFVTWYGSIRGQKSAKSLSGKGLN
ncbi:MAG: hypothetical protein O9295_06400 [Microcystis sp. LE18-22.4A]|uniref:hypothetical protein n=1 Tax=Microcystis sp. LE18-22.4A TaxID=3016432 RepID=UPI0022C7C9C1|nr:hypothetical protein [Microcystis sp. LE18-22.4A]MCZ8117692.1 hypothetical protein [Microcystis sp. LE18-22.4A]